MPSRQRGPGQEERPAPSFDQRLERLEQLVGELEDGGLSLEQSLERYREGVAVLRECRSALDGFRRQVEELSREAEATLTPLAGDPDLPEGSAGEAPQDDA